MSRITQLSLAVVFGLMTLTIGVVAGAYEGFLLLQAFSRGDPGYIALVTVVIIFTTRILTVFVKYTTHLVDPNNKV